MMMMSRQKLLFLILSWISRYSVGQEIECVSGWGQDRKVIPAAWKNDGYCDCPFDGLDEPDTAACSGSAVGGWSGIPAARDQSPTFQCPQQPKLLLPLSRLNDGICDCCDGADEAGSTCPDHCNELLAEERAAREKAKRDFQIGFDKRQQDLKAFQEKVVKTKVDIEKIDVQLVEKRAQLKAKKAEIDVLKGEYMQKRFQAVSQTVKSVSSKLSEGASPDDEGSVGLFESLTAEEIANFIHLSCQIAGEMEDSSDESTCVPLRLAGLDAALMWDDENFETGTVTLSRIQDAVMLKKLASVLDHNAADLEGPIWSGSKLQRKTQNGRRRLDDEPDYESDDEEGNEEDDEDEEEEIVEEVNPIDSKKEEVVGKRKEMMDLVQATPFSQTRVKFMNRADKVIELIQGALASSEEGEGSESENTGTAGNVDPAAFQMVRGSLSRRQEGIRRGYKYAVSSLVLLGSLEEEAKESPDKLRSDLTTLAVGTLYHGKLSSEHVWQILQFVLPELSGDFVKSLTEGQQTCSSPLTGACPPRAIERSVGGKTVSIPSVSLLRSGDAVCSKLVDEALAGICAKDDENTIPTNTPDGYYGYFTPQPRNNSEDDLAKEFAVLHSLEVNRSVMEELENQREALETEGKELARQLHDLEDEIGGRDSSKFGFNGELHAFKDSCHSVEAGKYIYEVCVFGGAKQKDRDGGGSGTDLGNWEGIFLEEETGQRVLKWTNGARCWNGPQRSAIVYMTCGTENKILSAEEPETCVYRLEMESYMACDEAYKARFDL